MGDEKNPQTQVVNPAATPSGPANTDDIHTAVIRNTSNRVVANINVEEGPGAGQTVPVYPGTNALGRGDENRIVLNFGDDTISRKQHALITYDEDIDEFKIYDNGKPNAIFINDAELKGSIRLDSGDTIRIGKTLMKFTRS